MVDVIVAIVIALAVLPWLRRLLASILGLSTSKPGAGAAPPKIGIHMERDPVCGTFVVPSAAVTIGDGSRRIYFCSTTCRDKYRARPSTGSGRPEHVEGRTA